MVVVVVNFLSVAGDDNMQCQDDNNAAEDNMCCAQAHAHQPTYHRIYARVAAMCIVAYTFATPFYGLCGCPASATVAIGLVWDDDRGVGMTTVP